MRPIVLFSGSPYRYEVLIQTGIFHNLPKYIESYPHRIVITNSHVYNHYQDDIDIISMGKTIIIAPGEQHKNAQTVETIWSSMAAYGADRHTLMVTIGGGVIGDIGGFAASTYMRGISYMQVPTSLLAMVDASIGGKTGINVAGIKNLVGTVTQPNAVYIDPLVLRTLPKRELISGFAEMVKHALIADAGYFTELTRFAASESSVELLEQYISTSVYIKKHIVESDPLETGLRKVLNAGHTVGHALESYSLTKPNPLLHGEAVAIGLIAEARMAQKMGLLREKDVVTIIEGMSRIGLPISYIGVRYSDLVPFMNSDKKNRAGLLKWTLLNGIGHVQYDVEIPESAVRSSIEETVMSGS